jgi:hypothetical protein
LIRSFRVRRALVLPSAISAAAKNLDDGQQVVCQLSFLGSCIVDDDELDAELLEKMLEQFESEAAQSVSVRNCHFLDTSSDRVVQNGQQPGPLPINAAADVLDDIVGGEQRSHVIFLSLEISSLFLRRYSDVSNFLRSC